MLRPTAVFGIGGANVVKLIDDLNQKSFLYNFLKSFLYGTRKMNLVSVHNVVSSIIYLAFFHKRLSGEKFIVSDDDFCENNYKYIESEINNEYAHKKVFSFRPSGPKWLLRLVLKILNQSNINPSRVYLTKKLTEIGWTPKSNFLEDLRSYICWYKNKNMGKKLRVLNVNPTINTVVGGGTAERTVQMSYYLAENDVDCRIMATDYMMNDNIKSSLGGVKLLLLPCWSKRFTLPAPNFKVISDAVKNVDIVHLMNHWTVLNVLVFIFCA